MIVDQTCASISECYIQIEEDFGIDLSNNINNNHVLLRGENSLYDSSTSSISRFLISKVLKTMRPFYIIAPFIDFEDIYTEYHSTMHNLNEEEGAGFLQHYGFPTDLFDLTSSFETARFFASHGREDSPLGVIGAFNRIEMETHFTINHWCYFKSAPKPY